MKINDWSAIQSLFDELNKRLDKARKVADGVGVPKLYVRMICELEDFLTGEEEGGLGCRGCVESASSQCIPVIACGPLRRQQPMCDIPKCVCVGGVFVWYWGCCMSVGTGVGAHCQPLSLSASKLVVVVLLQLESMAVLSHYSC
jgi:hypothetical protein